MEKDEKIIGKIKALLSKTIDNGASQAEMESALSMANKLMLQHFISEHDIKDQFVSEKCVLNAVDILKSAYDFSFFYFSLARLFDCRSYFSKSKISFFGYEQDTELCVYFYSLITRTCLNEIELYKKSSEYKALSKIHHGRTLVSSFVKGFLLSVSGKMGEMYKNREGSLPASYGLMVIEKKKKVEEEYHAYTQNIRLKRLQRTGVRAEASAFNSGSDRGDDLILTQALDDKRSSLTPELY